MKGKGKEEYLYSAFLHQGTHKALSHGSHSFTCKQHHACLSPKICCPGNAPLSVVQGTVTDEFPDDTNPISKTNSASLCCIQLKLWLWPFLWFFGLFGPKFGCLGNVP